METLQNTTMEIIQIGKVHYGNEIIKTVNEVENSTIPQCKVASLNGIRLKSIMGTRLSKR